MRDLHITVNNKIATYLNRDGSIVCGNSDYRIVFTFDDEWDEYEIKTARFIVNGEYMDVEFSGDTVNVPALKNTTLLTVGVYAGKLDTTTPAKIPCLLSILCGSAVASESSEKLGGDTNHFITSLSVKAELAEETDTAAETVALDVTSEAGERSQSEETQIATEPVSVNVTSEAGEGIQADEAQTLSETIAVDVTSEVEVVETAEEETNE